MSRKISLPTLLKNLYAENSRFDIGPPVQILKELENNVLVLADIEISDDDVPVLARFFSHALTCKQIKRIQVERSSSKKAHVRRPDSSFTANGCRLLKELFKFIGNAKSLQCICFESLEIPIETLPLLGRALVSCTSEIRWLGIKECNFSGDAGFRILAHYLGQLPLQVLAVEQCGLTDTSLVYIASIIKAQQNNLDSLYWNATLRVDPNQRGSLWNASEIDAVYRQGMVALSLYGNDIECKDVYILTRVLRNNQWLLGLNLANNSINRESMLTLTQELLHNQVLQALLLKDNPGLDRHIAAFMHAAILRNTSDVALDTTRDVVEDLEERHANGSRRLDLQSPRIALLLRTWQQLQCTETVAPHMSIEPSKHPGNVSTTSAATIGSMGRSSLLRASHSKDKKAPTPGTRFAAEVTITTQLKRPYGYSALDLVTDRPSSAPSSPSRPLSPSRRSLNGSFTSFLANSFASALADAAGPHGGLDKQKYLQQLDAAHRSFTAGSTGKSARQNRSSSDFLSNNLAQRMESTSDSIQLSVNTDDLHLDDGHSEQKETPFDEQDVLDTTVPVASPGKGSIGVSGNPLLSGSYYIGVGRNGQRHDTADVEGVAAAEAWGDVDWPLAEDAQEHLEGPDAEGRPPSRISIRHHRSFHSSGGRTPSPTHDFEWARQNAMDEEYHRLQEYMKASSRTYKFPSAATSPTGRRLISAQDLSGLGATRGRLSSSARSLTHSRSRLDEVSRSRSTKPFYAGGSATIPKASPPPRTRKAHSYMDNTSSSGMRWAVPVVETFTRGRRKTTTGKRVKKKKNSSNDAPHSRGSAFGKAHGTRIRARSAERFDHQDNNSNNYNNHTGNREVTDLMGQLSGSVVAATRNLESVSYKLKDVIETLSTSMNMSISVQQELNASLLNNTMGLNVSRGTAWEATESSPGMTTPASYMRRVVPASASSTIQASPASAVRSSPSTGGLGDGPMIQASPASGARSSRSTGGLGDGIASGAWGGASQRYQDVRASPAPHSFLDDDEEDNRDGFHTVPGPSHASEQQTARIEALRTDTALAELVRNRMELKLRSMFET